MNTGDSIVHSSLLIETVWSQVQDLANSLTALTERALEDRELGNLRSAGAAKVATEWSESGFVATSYAVCFPVTWKTRGQGGPTAWINYEISVSGAGIPGRAPGYDGDLGPVLHVSFWQTPTDFDSADTRVAFPASWDDWDLQADRLVSWPGDRDDTLSQWTFTVRLLELDNEDTLHATVIAPMIALLGGLEAVVALPDTLPGLLFYANADLGESGWDLVASTKHNA